MMGEGITSVLLSCSTILMQSNSTLFKPFVVPDTTIIFSDHPMSKLNIAESPGCTTVIVDETMFQSMAFAIARSRVKASLVIVTTSNEIRLMMALQASPLNFDVHVATISTKSNNLLPEFERVSSVLVWDKRGKALRRTVRATYTLLPPYINNPTPPQPLGLDPSIMRLLAQQLKFELNFIYTKDYTELIKLVLFGKAEMALSQPNLINQRYKLGLDISPALTLRSFFFTKRHPVPIDSVYTIVYPFAIEVWLSIVFTVSAIAVTLYYMNRHYGLQPALTFEHISISYVPLVSESVPQEWFKEKNHNPHLVLMYVWLLLGFLLSEAYQSILLASLVKVDYETSPETFQDLLDQNIEVYTPEGGVMTILLRDSPFEVHRKVFQEALMDRGGFVPSVIPDAVTNEKIQKGVAVGIAPDDAMAAYRHLYIFGSETLSSGYIGYYYGLKMPLQNEINHGLKALQESGIMTKLREESEWPLRRNERNANRKVTSRTPVIIGLSHFQPVSIILGFGTGISVIVFIIEMVARNAVYFCFFGRKQQAKSPMVFYRRSCW